jgi:hypothetical protein
MVMGKAIPARPGCANYGIFQRVAREEIGALGMVDFTPVAS